MTDDIGYTTQSGMQELRDSGPMRPGLRHYKSASLRLAHCEALPEDMQDGAREILSLRCTNPRKGHGTALMRSVCFEADKAGKVLIVQPGQFDDGMTTQQLTRWYERFGFVALPKEDGNPTVMARCARRLTHG